jgi:hypothetical protein
MTKIASLLMLLITLLFAYALPNSNAWFTHSESLENQIVMGEIMLQANEPSSSNFFTTVNSKSVTVLGDDDQFDSVITVLSITLVNTGNIPLYVDAILEIDALASGEGLLYYIHTSGTTPESYLDVITTGLTQFDYESVQTHLNTLNATNLLYLKNNVTLHAYALNTYTIQLVLWVDYYEANLGNSAFDHRDYTLLFQFDYIHKFNP